MIKSFKSVYQLMDQSTHLSTSQQANKRKKPSLDSILPCLSQAESLVRHWYISISHHGTYCFSTNTDYIHKGNLGNAPYEPHILLISVSFVKESKLSKLSHHSKSIVLQISLNQGVNLRLGSLNIARRLSGVTYSVSWTSLGFGFRVTSDWMKRI